MLSPIPDSGAPADPHAESGSCWLAGRTAIVTGGGFTAIDGQHGVGFAICHLFARHGARVAVLDSDAQSAEVTVAEIGKAGGRAFCVIGDITSEQDCRRCAAEAVARFGRVDILVNTAAPGAESARLIVRSVLDVMPADGSIVNVSPVQPGAVSPAGPLGVRANCVQIADADCTCWDAAYAALYLASSRAGRVCGTVLTVGGGRRGSGSDDRQHRTARAAS